MSSRSRFRSRSRYQTMEYISEIIICVIGLSLNNVTAFNVTCGDGWSENPKYGSCLQLVPKKSSYPDSRSFCRGINADLVKVWDKTMNDVILGLIKQSNSSAAYYIGLKRSKGKIFFRWLDETSPANFLNWDRIKSREVEANEVCASIATGNEGWVAEHCLQKRSFICERKFGLCSNGYIPCTFSGTCLRFYSDEGTPWPNARQICQRQKADLVTINSEVMNKFVWEHAPNIDSKSYWIGLHDLNNSSLYQWLDDERAATFVNWIRSEPEASGKCASVRGTDMKWRTDSCEEKLYYVCEKPAGKDLGTPIMSMLTFATVFLSTTSLRMSHKSTTAANNFMNVRTVAQAKHHMTVPTSLTSSKDPEQTSTVFNFYNKTSVLECKQNTYGVNCSKQCSPNCDGIDKACNSSTGECLHGCVYGFIGKMCSRSFAMEFLTKNQVKILAVALAVVVLVIILMLCQLDISKLSQEGEEEEGEEAEDEEEEED